MSELPFVVVHGPLIWKAGVVGLGALGVKWGTHRLNKKSSQFVSRATQYYTAAVTGLEPGPILVRGRLRGGDAKSFEYGTQPCVHERGAATHIEIEGERIDFAGEVVVGCGSENRTSWWRRPSGAPSGQGWYGPKRLSMVRDGEEVLVSGVLSRATDHESDYREAATSWKIEPFPRQGAIGMVAVHHRARAMPRSPWRVLGAWSIYAVISVVALFFVGGMVHSSHPAFAAMMPGWQEDALRAYAHSADDHLAFAAREQMSGCSSAIDLMFERGYPDEALDAAQRCELPLEQAHALTALGRYAEAAKIADSHRLEVPVSTLVAAGRWKDAAHALMPSAVNDGRAGDICAVDYFEAVGTDRSTARLDGSTDVRCALLATALDPGKRDLYALAPDDDVNRTLQTHLEEIDGGVSMSWSDATSALTEHAAPSSYAVWTNKSDDASVASTMLAVYRGDYAKAHALTGALIARAPDDDSRETAQAFAEMVKSAQTDAHSLRSIDGTSGNILDSLAAAACNRDYEQSRGRDDRAKVWQGVVDRDLAVVTNRDQLTALALL